MRRYLAVLLAVLLSGSLSLPLQANPESIKPTDGYAIGSSSFNDMLGKQVKPGTQTIDEQPDGSFLLTNKLQTVSALITPQGTQFDSIGNSAGKGGFGLQLTQWGREGQLRAADSSAIYRSGDVVFHTHTNGIAEKFSNTTDGIRQDFVIPVKPEGSGDLRVELQVTGATTVAKEEGVIVQLASGRQLTYDRLKVTDSNNRAIPARMEIAQDNTLSVVVDDAAARYPLTIDPTVGDANWMPAGGHATGANGTVYAVATWGNDVYVGGSFTLIGDTLVNYLARWDGSSWHPVGGGTSPGVFSLAFDSSGNLYVGGSFTQAGSISVNRIAKWDGSNWSALGSGFNSTVKSLVVDGNGVLYASGVFTTSGALTVNRVARWDGSSWSALGTGANAEVATLAVDGANNLYAGGNFSQMNGASAYRVAKWNGSSWSSIGSGLNAFVRTLAFDSEGNLYAGGDFTGYIARLYSGSIWQTVGNGTNNPVYKILPVGNDLYVAGNFSKADTVFASRIVRWSGGQWQALNGGANDIVRSMAMDASGKLYIGGDFTSVGSTAKARIASWSQADWQWFRMATSSSNGFNDTVLAMTTDVAGNLYVAGRFTNAGGVTANRIAKWNGSGWNSLGSGLGNVVYTLATDSHGNLYAGGQFNSVAKWDGYTWRARLSNSINTELNGSVYALAIDSQDNVYAGGDFKFADGQVVKNIAKWNGSAWSALYDGLTLGSDGSVLALALDGNDNLYVGVTRYASPTEAYVQRWNGSAWNRLGTLNMNNSLRTLAVDSTGSVYAAGDFTLVGASALARVGKWNGSSWVGLGSGINGTVYALSVDPADRLYAGGAFTDAGGVTVSNIARWDGSSWSPLGSGITGSVTGLVSALLRDAHGDLQVGGSFFAAGNKASVNWATWLVTDTDNDGLGDRGADNDDDNDGVEDSSDAFPLDASESVDTDSDGIGDNSDPSPWGTADSDHDSLPDLWEQANGRDPLKADYIVSAGGSHSCALDNNGVKCWGQNTYGQSTMPALSNPTAVSAGYRHTCAIDATGVKCWGAGTTNTGTGDSWGQSIVPALTNPVAVSAGFWHSCAIDDTGVKCWGKNTKGQTNVPALGNPVQVAAGRDYTCALDDNGINCWGVKAAGRLNVPALTNPRSISVTDRHACAVDDNGVVCWGLDTAGQSTVPGPSGGAEQSAVGTLHSCALGDGDVVCWGDNAYGQLAVPSLNNPARVDGGMYHSCALDSTGVQCWGRNNMKQATVPVLDFTQP